MPYNAPTDLQSVGTTTETDDRSDDCGCTALMACWPCYRDGNRGRPAIRRVN